MNNIKNNDVIFCFILMLRFLTSVINLKIICAVKTPKYRTNEK